SSDVCSSDLILRAALENWLAHGVPIGAHPRRRTRLRNNGHDRLHCRRERDGPLQRLHATHRQPGDGEKLVYAKDVSSEPVLGSNHVHNREPRKCCARLTRAVAGRNCLAVTECVRRDNEMPCGIEGLPRPDKEVMAGMVCHKRRQDEDRIIAACVERPMRRIGQKNVFENLPGLKLQVPKIKKKGRTESRERVKKKKIAK